MAGDNNLTGPTGLTARLKQTYYDVYICPLYWVNISCSENPQLDRSVDIDLQKQDNTM